MSDLSVTINLDEITIRPEAEELELIVHPTNEINVLVERGLRGPPTSVNGHIGENIILDPDDFDDTLTVHKFTSAEDIAKLAAIEVSAKSGTLAAAVNGTVTTAGTPQLLLAANVDLLRLIVSNPESVGNVDGHLLRLDFGAPGKTANSEYLYPGHGKNGPGDSGAGFPMEAKWLTAIYITSVVDEADAVGTTGHAFSYRLMT